MNSTQTDLTHGISGALQQIMDQHFHRQEQILAANGDLPAKTRTIEYSLEEYHTWYDYKWTDSEQEMTGYQGPFSYDLLPRENDKYNELLAEDEYKANDYLREEVLPAVCELRDFDGYPNLNIQLDSVGEEQ